MTFKKIATKMGLATAVLAMGLGVLPATGVFDNTPMGAVQVDAATTKYTTTANLNMRTGASTKYKRITTIPKGKAVTYVTKKGSWYKVKYGSKTGYVSSKYLKKVSTAKTVKASATPKATTSTKYYTKADLNMRTGASTKYKRITTIPKGKAVTYVSKSGSWYKVKYGSKTGYVSSSYLTKSVSSTKTTTTKTVKYPAPSTKTPGKYAGGVLIVNKKYGLPSNYYPGVNSTAQKAVNAMVADAKKQGIYLNPFSTFRSYSRQSTLYNNYVRNYGRTQADRFSAKPGHSEHQTGLAFDFGGRNSSLWAEDGFAYTTEAKWLATNAHKYGFVLRYPKGKEKITGYMYEPWHFRYIGTDNATKVKASGKTLEEYYKVSGK